MLTRAVDAASVIRLTTDSSCTPYIQSRSKLGAPDSVPEDIARDFEEALDNLPRHDAKTGQARA